MPRTRSNRNPSRRISRGMRVAAAALILFGVVGCDEDPPEGEHPDPPADETPDPPPADETPDPPADETPADTYVPPDAEEPGQGCSSNYRWNGSACVLRHGNTQCDAGQTYDTQSRLCIGSSATCNAPHGCNTGSTGEHGRACPDPSQFASEGGSTRSLGARLRALGAAH